MLHSSAQFKFEFNSDSSVEDVGYWIDDFLILYDQRARDSEYGVNLIPGSQIPPLPGQTVTREIIIENTGNVSDSYALTRHTSALGIIFHLRQRSINHFRGSS